MLLIVAVIVGLIVMQFFQRYFEIVMSFAE
jgi:hypothetical protein